MEELRYPVGKYVVPTNITPENIKEWIAEIEQLPAKLKETIKNFKESDLETTYRPDGWTARQVIHHLADSHMNAYTRFKLAMTEEHPAIRPYHENLWAELSDGKSAPVYFSINILEAVHARWVLFLRSVSADDFKRTLFHPESKKIYVLDEFLALYAWHCRHHLGHLEIVKAKLLNC